MKSCRVRGPKKLKKVKNHENVKKSQRVKELKMAAHMLEEEQP